MAAERVERRLAAILAADVVGYSRLMGADEEGTLSRLNALRQDYWEPKVAEHRGRIVKRTGDGVLIEFASVVDAANYAAEIQRGMIERKAEMPDDKRIELRMGLHIGDIIIEGDDIFGDGVNIAARLEGVADPGGICMSDDAYRQVRGKVEVDFEDTGEHDLADGIVEDIITGLSRIKWLFVIARNSTFVYKGQAVDVKKVGRELGVRYVLEGSVRKAGNKLRITGQLIDAKTGAHVWAERYDGALDDIFELQDRITASVVGAIEPNLRRAEIDRSKRKRPDSLDAYDCYLRAFPLAYANTPDDAREALRLLDQALRLEATYAAAHGLAAWCHEQLYYRAGFRDENKTAVLRHAAAAISHGGDDSTALMFAGFAISLTVGDHQAAINAVDRALALNPSYAAGYAHSAMVRALAGQYETAIEHAQRAIRLNPLDPTAYPPYFAMTLAYLRLGRFEEALTAVANAIQLNPKFTNIHALHIVALVKLGRMEAARAAVSRLLELMPGYGARMLTALPMADKEFGADLTELLRSAGIPG